MDPKPTPHAGFSLVAGGPAHWIQQRLGLTQPGAPKVLLRAALSVLLTWIPLLVLSAVEGTAIGHRVRLPFLYDFAAYARFLVAVPLLILAEGLVERRVADTAGHFVNSGLVRESDLRRYDAALHRCMSMRDSTVAEVVLLALAAIGVAASNGFPFEFSSWRSIVTGSAHARTWTGWWYLVVGMGLFQFLSWRWLWKLLIWYRFLWLTSRLELRLIPTHPDRAAGLGFVGDTQKVFWTIAFAFSAAAAGVLANETVHAGVPLKGYEFSIGGFVVLVLLVFLAPLLMFTPRMVEARDKSLHEYGSLAAEHNRMFDRKWVRGENPNSDPVLGTPEISSLADLGSVYDVLVRMRPVPFDPADAVVLALAALVPMAPLLLSVMPLDRLLELVSKLLV